MHMFYDNGFFMGGMHGFWWIFWITLIGVLVVHKAGQDNHKFTDEDIHLLTLLAGQAAIAVEIANGPPRPERELARVDAG